MASAVPTLRGARVALGVFVAACSAGQVGPSDLMHRTGSGGAIGCKDA